MSRERMKKGIWILCAVMVLGILCEFLANLPALLSLEVLRCSATGNIFSAR